MHPTIHQSRRRDNACRSIMQSIEAKTGYAAFAMSNRLSIAAVAALLALTSPALAGYDEGMAAYKAGDYAAALPELRAAADGGHARAQYALGSMYNEGKGVAPDAAQAAEWWNMAAEQNHAQAQFSLGVLYSSGKGVAKDNVAAHMWFSLAAAQGKKNAKRLLKVIVRQMTPEQIAEAESRAEAWRAAHP
jgi:TPR repeat protein